VKQSTAFVFDVLALAIFVVVGRLTHGENAEFFKVTVLPFGLGLLAGWVVGILRNFQSGSIMFGVMVWGATVFFGIGLRSFFGGDIPFSFIAVTATVLGILLVGWRALFAVQAARSSS
jgi:Protein of unknown function (DUF3054)